MTTVDRIIGEIEDAVGVCSEATRARLRPIITRHLNISWNKALDLADMTLAGLGWKMEGNGCPAILSLKRALVDEAAVHRLETICNTLDIAVAVLELEENDMDITLEDLIINYRTMLERAQAGM